MTMVIEWIVVKEKTGGDFAPGVDHDAPGEEVEAGGVQGGEGGEGGGLGEGVRHG